MSNTSLERRLRRRAVHRSRSTAVSIALVVLVLVAAWIGLEAVLAAVGTAPLLVAPQDAVNAALRPDAAGTTIAVASAVVLLVIGIWLIALALGPGRLHRRSVPNDRAVVVVDDRIVASTAVSAAALAAGISPDQVDAWSKGRRIGVRIVPTSGFPVDEHVVKAAIEDRLQSLDSGLAHRVSVDIASKGVLA